MPSSFFFFVYLFSAFVYNFPYCYFRFFFFYLYQFDILHNIKPSGYSIISPDMLYTIDRHSIVRGFVPSPAVLLLVPIFFFFIWLSIIPTCCVLYSSALWKCIKKDWKRNCIYMLKLIWVFDDCFYIYSIHPVRITQYCPYCMALLICRLYLEEEHTNKQKQCQFFSLFSPFIQIRALRFPLPLVFNSMPVGVYKICWMHYMCLLVPIAAQEVSTICLRLTHTPLQVFKSASTFKVKKAKYYELAYDENTIIIFNFFQHLIKVCHVLYSFHSRIFRMIMTSVVRDVHGNTVSNSWLPEWSCMNLL